MAFAKLVIKDRIVIGGRRYNLTLLGDGRYEIVPSPDTVTEVGTSLNAALFQRYEDTIDDLYNTFKPYVEAEFPKVAYLEGATFTGDVEVPKLIISGHNIEWNPVDGTINIQLNNGTVLQVGQEIYFYGKALSPILNGQGIQFAGVQGDHILMKPAVADEIAANPTYYIGIATQDIPIGEFGYVTWIGYVRDIDTNGYSVGQILYANSASGAAAGTLTATKPSAERSIIEAATVVKLETGGAHNGILLSRPTIISRKMDEIAGLVSALDSKLTKSPTDGKYYVIKDGAVIELTPTALPDNIPQSKISSLVTDLEGKQDISPTDGKLYVLKDGGLVELIMPTGVYNETLITTLSNNGTVDLTNLTIYGKIRIELIVSSITSGTVEMEIDSKDFSPENLIRKSYASGKYWYPITAIQYAGETGTEIFDGLYGIYGYTNLIDFLENEHPVTSYNIGDKATGRQGVENPYEYAVIREDITYRYPFYKIGSTGKFITISSTKAGFVAPVLSGVTYELKIYGISY